MGNKAKKPGSWLSRFWDGFIRIITAPFVAVARLIERVVSGKDGVQKADEEAKRREEESLHEKEELALCEMEEKSINELIKAEDDREQSPWKEDTVVKVKVNPSRLPDMKRTYSVVCDNGKKYTLFINKDGSLVRNEVCPSAVAFQIKELLAKAAFDKSVEENGEPDVEEPKNPFVGASVSIRGQEDVKGFCTGEFFLDENGQYMPYITFSKQDIDAFSADDVVFDSKELQDLYLLTREVEEKTSREGETHKDTQEPQNCPVSKENADEAEIPQGEEKTAVGEISQTYDLSARGFVVRVDIDENGKGSCICEKGETKLSLSAERRNTGVVVVTGEPSVIAEAKRMNVLADMKKSIADAYAKQEHPLDGEFIEDVRILAKKVIDSQDGSTVAFVCKNTIFSPEISDKEMKVSSQYSIGKKNKPAPVRLGERRSVSETDRGIVKAFATVEGAIRGTAVPKNMIFRTENEAFAVLGYNGKPDAVSLTYDEGTGSVVIEGDRVLQYSEIKSVCDMMGDKTNLSPFRQKDIYGTEEKKFVAKHLDSATNGEQWCVSRGLLACVRQDYNGDATLELRVVIPSDENPLTSDENTLFAEVPLPNGVDLSSAVDTGVQQITDEQLQQMIKEFNEEPEPSEQIN